MTSEELKKLIKTGENGVAEFKRGRGGVSGDFWPSYSAFANTDGGVIVLGVSEKNDIRVIEGVENAEKVRADLWNAANNPDKVSDNVLSNKRVYSLEVDGKVLVVAEVPRADRRVKPVYVGSDVFKGTYRRNGEGDYHCSREAVEAEKEQVAISFGDVRSLALSGDSLDKILVKPDGSGSSEENADASIFHDGEQPPLHLVECKYRILPGGGSSKGLGAKSLLDKVNRQIQKTRAFLADEKYRPADGGFLVTNHDVAETLYDVLENERSGGASYDFEVGNTEGLKSWLSMRCVKL